MYTRSLEKEAEGEDTDERAEKRAQCWKKTKGSSGLVSAPRSKAQIDRKYGGFHQPIGCPGSFPRVELLAYLHCSQSRPARHARLPSEYHCSRVLHS